MHPSGAFRFAETSNCNLILETETAEGATSSAKEVPSQSMSLDLTTIDDSTAPNGAVLRAYSQDHYRFLRANRREIYGEWPPAFYGRLFSIRHGRVHG